MGTEGGGQVDGGAVLGGGRRMEKSLDLSTHGHLFLQLPTQLFILPAEGV